MDQEDRLPKIVCDTCFLKLRAAKELKETSITSNSMLRRSLIELNTINVKQEDNLKTNQNILSIKTVPIEMLTMESLNLKREYVKVVDSDPIVHKKEHKKRKILKTGKTDIVKKRLKKVPVSITTDESLLHECVDCGRKYDNLVYFENHRCKVARRTCSICDAKFEEKKDFLQHFKDVHFSDRECKKCNFVVKSAKSLHFHIRFVFKFNLINFVLLILQMF